MEYVKSLVAQMKERDAEVAQAATVARDHVEEAVREKLQAAKDSENDIREMKQRIEVVKLETEELRREVRRREHYKVIYCLNEIREANDDDVVFCRTLVNTKIRRKLPF